MNELSPIMRQYEDAKAKHPGMILLFRMGDFYEAFNDDAKTIGQVIGLTITWRDKNIPMAGFPYHSLESHLRKLLSAGHRVAICEQVETAEMVKNRLIKREVTRIVIPDFDHSNAMLHGRDIQHDNSGVGHNWRNIAAVDIPADIREEIVGEIVDGKKDECECFVGSNGLHYRW